MWIGSFLHTCSEKLSPLLRLRDYAGSLNLSVPSPSPAPATNAPPNADNTGCYSGGLIFTTFADHPCAPVALTRKDPQTILNTEAHFFEWFLQQESNGTFDLKGQSEPLWNRLLLQGVRTLRIRIEQLARGNIVILSLSDLLALAETGTHPVLTVESRYGVRRLSVQALFLDQTPEKRASVAGKWAEDMLVGAGVVTPFQVKGAQLTQEAEELAFKASRKDLTDAEKMTSTLWAAYTDDDLVRTRTLLSELFNKTKRTPDEETELSRLVKYFGIKDLKKARPACRKNCVDISCLEGTDKSKRWAALMIVVQLLALKARSQLQLEKINSEMGGASEPDASLLGPIQTDDVYLALYPVPQSPVVLPFHEGTNPAGNWSIELRRWRIDGVLPPSRRGSKDWGNLALHIPDVLEGNPWEEDPGKPWEASFKVKIPKSGLTEADVIAALHNLNGVDDVLVAGTPTVRRTKAREGGFLTLRVLFHPEIITGENLRDKIQDLSVEIEEKLKDFVHPPTSWTYGLLPGEKVLMQLRPKHRLR